MGNLKGQDEWKGVINPRNDAGVEHGSIRISRKSAHILYQSPQPAGDLSPRLIAQVVLRRLEKGWKLSSFKEPRLGCSETKDDWKKVLVLLRAVHGQRRANAPRELTQPVIDERNCSPASFLGGFEL